jgi:hypothetical protein
MLSIGGSLGGASYGGGKVATDAFKSGGGGIGLGQFAGGAMTVGSIMAEGLADNPFGIAKQAMSVGSMIPGIGTAFAVGSMALDVAGMFMDDGSGEKAYQEAYQLEMDRIRLQQRNEQQERMLQAKLDMVSEQIDNNWEAAGDSWMAEQRRLNEVYDKAAFTSQALLQKLIQVQGAQAAGERYGKSAARANLLSSLGSYGRSRAQISRQLTSERIQATESMRITASNLEKANKRAFAQVAVAPTPEMMLDPVYTDFTADPLGQALKIGQGAATSLKKGWEMTPIGDKFFGIEKKPTKRKKDE